MRAAPADPVERARRIGRRVGVIVFAGVMTTFTAVCAAQILRQVWAPSAAPTSLGCRQGVAALIRAVDRARHAAAENAGDEATALQRFRAALEPEWSTRPAVDASCSAEKWAKHALVDVDQLRFAEEHAVRYEAGGLARRRRRVEALLTTLETGGTPPSR